MRFPTTTLSAVAPAASGGAEAEAAVAREARTLHPIWNVVNFARASQRVDLAEFIKCAQTLPNVVNGTDVGWRGPARFGMPPAAAGPQLMN